MKFFFSHIFISATGLLCLTYVKFFLNHLLVCLHYTWHLLSSKFCMNKITCTYRGAEHPQISLVVAYQPLWNSRYNSKFSIFKGYFIGFFGGGGGGVQDGPGCFGDLAKSKNRDSDSTGMPFKNSAICLPTWFQACSKSLSQAVLPLHSFWGDASLQEHMTELSF